jgi:plasmid maintenance system antidote protein VapI
MAKFTDSDIIKIRELRAEGKSCKELAELFNTRYERISRICTRKNWAQVAGGPTADTFLSLRKKINNSQKNEIRALQISGMTYRSIGRIYGIGKSRIGRIVRSET